jgi:thiol-disulfide isomerase/thioredoxin
MLALLLAASILSVGEPAPPVAVKQLLQAPEGAKAAWPNLRGKAVVLEFWATWCAPCVEQIPHWNALAERFRDRPIQFLAISSEGPETVAQFLAKRPTAGWIGLDTDGTAFKAYGIEGVPYTVLIDAKGVVRGITSLQDLTAAELDALLAGREVKAPAPRAPG